jgi:flagellar hook assembly protein FlgD
VFDLLGRRVTRLVEGSLPAGARLVTWDGRNERGIPVAAGMYVIRFRAAGAVESRRVLLAP